MHEDTPSDEARIRNLEGLVAQLQATVGELEEQLKLDDERMKGNEQETITEHLQKHDYALAMRRLSQEVEKLKFEKKMHELSGSFYEEYKTPFESLLCVFEGTTHIF